MQTYVTGVAVRVGGAKLRPGRRLGLGPGWWRVAHVPRAEHELAELAGVALPGEPPVKAPS